MDALWRKSGSTVEPMSGFLGNQITLAHGGGGKAMNDLIKNLFASQFCLDWEEDQSRFPIEEFFPSGSQLAFTTDSFVVNPILFPGGDIGKLSVCGTVNDLAVGGARPLFLSTSFIIEEGFEVDVLSQLVLSMKSTAEESGVRIVTGDTKVVNRQAADKIFITTSGVGVIPPGRNLSSHSLAPGDVVLVNGYLGDHGAAILSARGEMALKSKIESDCKPLNGLMETILQEVPRVKSARDATRGGLAAVLNELAVSSGVGIKVVESRIPVREEVKGVCEILGLDPLYLANEGTLALFASSEDAEKVLEVMRNHPAGREAAIVGKVVAEHTGLVIMDTPFGGNRVVDILVGDQLPRIC